VLLDEIDKADPDVPNNLLVPLGSLVFTVDDLDNLKVCASAPPLIFITTNEERQLPPAFLRRCVVLELHAPGKERLLSIASAHFGAAYQDLFNPVADLVLQSTRREDGSQAAPSTAEFLDAVRTCIRLNVLPGSEDWDSIASITLWKPRGPLGGL
jgi:MoxR-like ATPase